MNRSARFVAVGFFAAVFAFGQTREHWIPTWVAAPQQGRPEPIRLPQAGPPPAAQAQAGSQNAQQRPAGPIVSFNNQTLRMIVHTSIGGSRVRVQLSNVFSAGPLHIGSAHIALRAKDSAIVPGSDRALTFSGKPSFVIPPGAVEVSDPVNLAVPQRGDLAVSVYVPGDSGPATQHSVGLQTTYISQGDATGASKVTDAKTTQSWYFLTGVDVAAPANAAAVVTFGDSITDGTRSTPNTNSSWPSFLAARLQATPATSRIAVLNEGISGNRINRDGIGPAGLARFDRDVLTQPDVRWVTILIGINDIGAGEGEFFVFGPRDASDNPTPDDIIGGYRQMIEKAHAHGIQAIGCTLLPFEGAPYYSDSGNVVRQAVNQWIRTSHAFDAVVDFDAATKSPDNPNHIRPEFDSGDHLHPNDAGYKAMAEAVDLSIFRSPAVSASK